MKYEEYVLWYVQHPKQRKPETPKLLIESGKISIEKMQEYMAMPTFFEDCAKKAQKWGQARIPELIHKLYDVCKEKPSASNISAYLDLIGIGAIGKDAVEEDPYDISRFNITDEQRKQIINRLSSRGVTVGKRG